MLLSPNKNLGDRSVVAGQSLAKNDYIGRSGALGAAVNNFLGSYVTQSVQYDVENPPTGYDIGPGVVRVHPPYRSGYAYVVGTDAFVSAMGTLVTAPGKPVVLIGGRVTLLDVKEGDNPQPIQFFTNSVGRFAIANLLPGRRYLVETYGPNGTIDRSFEFAVPADTNGLVTLGTVQAGASK
jgi:outer membrane usher protein